MNGQGVTNPHGIGSHGFNIYKPDIQMPIPEKVTPHITMEPETFYKPQMEFHTKGRWCLAGALYWCSLAQSTHPATAQI